LVQARRLAPLDARVHRQLGIVFFDKGLHQKALDSLAHASALDPTDARSSFVMGLIHDARRDPAGAIGHYRRALAIDPGLVDARCTLADALATMGEIAEAARELEQAQRQDRTSTRIAQNLELLRRGLRDLEAQRLLGQTEAEVERSTLVKQGQLKRKGTVRSGDGTAVRYGSPAFELWVHGSSERIEKLCFLLLDPEKSSLERDDAFEVIVVAQDGRSERADLATAATLTFLREALGCPLTRASEIYRQLLSDPRPVAWAGADVGFVEVELDGRVFIALAVSVGA
jgi:tetratricopeptide (TPR) repeat protein